MNEDQLNDGSRFEEVVARVRGAVEGLESGKRSNVAIISEPFYGEGALLELLESSIYPRSEWVASIDVFGFHATKSVVIVEGLHRLYQRRIGGFDEVKRFMNLVSSSDRLFVVTCNVFSWEYLDQVLGIGDLFPVQVTLPRLSAVQIKGRVLSGYEEDELEFVAPEEPPQERISPIRPVRREVSLGPLGRRARLPWVEVGRLGDLMPRIGRRVEISSPKDAFFERLARISGGNPGIVDVLWRTALEYPKVRGEALEEPAAVDVDYDSSFVLSLIMSMGPLDGGALEEMAGPVDDIIYVLRERGLISADGETVTLRPEAMRGAVEHLRRLRLVR